MPRVLAALLVLLVAGCAPELRDGQFTCTDGVCPDGLRCCAGVCARVCEDGGLDAGGLDAGARDAGARDAAGLDASDRDASDRDGSGPDASGPDASGPDAGAGDAGTDDRDGGPDPCVPACTAGRSCGPGLSCVLDHSVASCQLCSRDVQCGVGLCIQDSMASVAHCLPLDAGACDGPIYTTPLGGQRSVDGVVANVCGPPGTVSCAAVRAALEGRGCAVSSTCSGGTCDPISSMCTIDCNRNQDCPADQVCFDALCRPM